MDRLFRLDGCMSVVMLLLFGCAYASEQSGGELVKVPVGALSPNQIIYSHYKEHELLVRAINCLYDSFVDVSPIAALIQKKDPNDLDEKIKRYHKLIAPEFREIANNFLEEQYQYIDYCKLAQRRVDIHYGLSGQEDVTIKGQSDSVQITSAASYNALKKMQERLQELIDKVEHKNAQDQSATLVQSSFKIKLLSGVSLVVAIIGILWFLKNYS